MRESLRIGCFIYAILSASVVAISPSAFLATNRPTHLATLTLLCTGALLFLIATRLHPGPGSPQGDRYESIPLHNRGVSTLDIVKEKHTVRPSPLKSRSLLLIILGATLGLTTRIEIHRRVLLSAECTTRSREVWLPLLVAFYDAVRFQQFAGNKPAIENDHQPHGKLSGIAKSWTSLLVNSSWRFIPSATFLSFGCYLVTGLWWSSESTFICPVVSSDSWAIPMLQWLALALDVLLAISVVELGLKHIQPVHTSLTAPISWTYPIFLSAGLWLLIALVVCILQPENRVWMLVTIELSPTKTLLLLLCQAVFLASMCTSILYSITSYGLLLVSMISTTLLVLIPGFRFSWSITHPYPPISSISLTWSFVTVYVAWALFAYTRAVVYPSKRKIPNSLLVFVILSLVLLHYPGFLSSDKITQHPIDRLIQQANDAHDVYLRHASQSRNLADAVRIYKDRHHDTPPSGFDVWYKFAQERSVLVIDEFDQIYNDLLPFRAFSPSELRSQTWELVSNPWNEISGISIRDGKATIQENIIPTHRWMLEGIVRILDSFSQYLPDMDVAFNLNDECRVAVPFEELRRLEDKALASGFRGTASFSTHRSAGWHTVTKAINTETVFEDWSFRSSFHEWLAPTCPPGSAARGRKLYRSQICFTCTAEHTDGQFVSNWSAAADPCHQPDLASLHGFYLSPSSFKTTNSLRPVFSQSKAKGFNDIIYPSAWNYIDKVAYAPTDKAVDGGPAFPDPLFRHKKNILFWRGATTEGISDGHGTWRGMTRQRMVHMANNLTKIQNSEEILLLPSQAQHFQYTRVPGTSLLPLGLDIDAHFVDKIARCGGRDCYEQADELGLVDSEPFQGHWRYKYLIDLDGAGFSGRFLPFLQSHSLPFKAALFREWYDSRLIPWRHFVPIDLRLHGLWSTLAYFTGIHGIAQGGQLNWNGHEDAGQLIAESGREWSKKALTKADMEVYFFRLLLEWGRLTDDKRADIGFAKV